MSTSPRLTARQIDNFEAAGDDAFHAILEAAEACGSASCLWAVQMVREYAVPPQIVVLALDDVFSGARTCPGMALVTTVIGYLGARGL